LNRLSSSIYILIEVIFLRLMQCFCITLFICEKRRVVKVRDSVKTEKEVKNLILIIMKIKALNLQSLRLFIFLLIFCVKCNTEGHFGVSSSIDDSKERDTFLYTCSISTSSEKTSDLFLPTVKEVFVEKLWFVGKPDSTHNSEFLNLAIIINDHSFFEQYAIGDFSFADKNILILRVDRSQFVDTLKFGLYKWDNFYTREKGKKICDVYIVHSYKGHSSFDSDEE
jgi:hypothetical protein